ncbi:MAG: polysaccharide export protein [Candidatus Eisenbacteria bacterium]|uniref:Polysaccharide export protein n=1 Tax=Eiseniibacteriota bacterium TaxID=2212470 RepID=A0A948RX29_UNCEI|nr:polysaccharide export protein [Candidatus Eisenbacteria bacterium]MBU1950141.1 polysaccharide export protein [Candidatus Eisenbacteria bacterium]MBU2690627.1 polysaccharide export protein [Candidatus Eisenbacteria bacterium]
MPWHDLFGSGRFPSAQWMLGLLVILIPILTSCGGGTDIPPPGLNVQIPDEGSGAPPSYFSDYVLQADDEITVRVLANPEMNATVPIRPDGTVSIPGAGVINAGGMTPSQLADVIETRLGQLIRQPQVDVLVTELRPRGIYVMGEVEAPGERVYRPGMSVLQALGAAGGALRSGKLSSVLLMRRVGPEDVEVRRVDIEAIFERTEGAVDPLLAPNDIVFVPKTWISRWGQFVDEYIRPTIQPFALYVQAWWAMNLTSDSVNVTF